MNNAPITFEEELATYGKLIYTNKGNSMEPFIRQGHDLFVISQKPEGRLRKYDAPLYKNKNGQYVLHRIVKVREQDYVICGDNCIWREFGITDSQILGVLTAIIRDGKTEIPVTDPGYLRKVHLWCALYPVRAVLRRLRMLPRHIRRKLAQ